MNAFSAGKRHFFMDAFSMIHDVITTASTFPYTAKFICVCVKNNRTQQIRGGKMSITSPYPFKCRIEVIYIDL